MNTTEEYKGCRNCKYQPEPMQTCDWIKHQKEVYRVCPMWKLKEDKGGGMMERLVEELYTFKGKVEDCENDYFISVQEKLREYEDLEEQGLLLRLPCKVGTTIYSIANNGKIYPVKATREVRIVNDMLHIICESCSYSDLVSYDDIGKTVFLTKEEAEQKLKKMESK